MIFIAHRGNINGRQPERENTVAYIEEALKKGYPNLHGEWVFTDKSGLSTRLKISMKGSENYLSGKYQVSQSWGRTDDVKDFILVTGRDMYGDIQTLGCNKELYEKFGLDPENNSEYIFSIHTGSYGEPMLRMESRSWGIWNNMYGKGMGKINNKVEF